MPRREKDRPNGLDDFMTGPEMRSLHSSMWIVGSALADSGMISGRDYDRTAVIEKHRVVEKAGSLRRPVSLVDVRRPNFTISAETYKSYSAQFHNTLEGPLNSDEAQNVALVYSTFTAWGEFIFRKLVSGLVYEKSLARLAVASNLVADKSDFTEHFSKRFKETEMEGLMQKVDDAAIIELNGLRAGLSLVRAGMQDVEMDPFSEDIVLACNAALEAYVAEEGPQYVSTTTDILHLPAKQGVDTFTYAVPEWMYVLAVPMSPAKVLPLMDEKWVNKVGPCDWNPSIEVQL